MRADNQEDKSNIVGMAGPKEKRDLDPDKAKHSAHLWGEKDTVVLLQSLDFGVSLLEQLRLNPI